MVNSSLSHHICPETLSPGYRRILWPMWMRCTFPYGSPSPIRRLQTTISRFPWIESKILGVIFFSSFVFFLVGIEMWSEACFWRLLDHRPPVLVALIIDAAVGIIFVLWYLNHLYEFIKPLGYTEQDLLDTYRNVDAVLIIILSASRMLCHHRVQVLRRRHLDYLLWIVQVEETELHNTYIKTII